MERDRRDIVENMTAKTAESAAIVGKAAEEPAKVAMDYLMIWLLSKSRRNKTFFGVMSFLWQIHVGTAENDPKRLERLGIKTAV